MSHRTKGIMGVKEELLDELESYKCILPSRIYKYLESVVNLEISALRHEKITQEQASALAKLKIYREILYYNVCGRALTYKEENTPKYFTEDYLNSFSICYGDLVNNVALFNVNRIGKDKTDNYNVNISLANYYEPTLTDVTRAYYNKMDELKKSFEVFNSRFSNGSKSNSENLYDRIKDYTLDDLKEIWNREKEFVKRQNYFYEKFMDDADLEYTSDFDLQNDGSLILKEEASKIYIKREIKTPIFR